MRKIRIAIVGVGNCASSLVQGINFYDGASPNGTSIGLMHRQIGGYRPKKISGPHRDWLVRRCRTADFTLRGLVAELAERGLKVDYKTVWEFVHAEKLSYKKRR